MKSSDGPGQGAAKGTAKLQFRFWFSDKYGLIRQRSRPGELFHPEVWRKGRWEVGSPYVMDAITGMGGSGDIADDWDEERASGLRETGEHRPVRGQPGRPARGEAVRREETGEEAGGAEEGMTASDASDPLYSESSLMSRL